MTRLDLSPTLAAQIESLRAEGKSDGDIAQMLGRSWKADHDAAKRSKARKVYVGDKPSKSGALWIDPSLLHDAIEIEVE